MKIIADIGSNYNGDIELAKELIKKAKECGADIVKFQSFKAEDLRTNNHPQFKIYKKFELTRSDHVELIKHCDKIGIEFLSSPFNIDAVNDLKELGISFYKVASSQALNIPLLTEMSKHKIPIVLSTGMINEQGLDYITSLFKIDTIMYCKAEYPCRFTVIDSGKIVELQNKYKVGLSSHTQNVDDIIQLHKRFDFNYIEVHIRGDEKIDTPDYFHSLSLEQLKRLCDEVKKS